MNYLPFSDRRYLLAFVLSLIVFASCKKNPGNDIQQVQLNKNKLLFTAAAGVDSFVVQSAIAWTIKGLPDWLTVTPETGSGTTTVRVSCAKNETFHKRSGSISIYTNSEYPSTIEVEQQELFVAILGTSYSAAGGEQMKIYGQGFSANTGGTHVKINGVELDVVASTTDQVTVVIPMGLGSGPIEVTVGDHKATADFDFIYRWVGTLSVYAGALDAGDNDGPVASARFQSPGGLHFDKNGNLFVADYGNYKVRKITPAGTVSTLQGRIAHPFLPPGGPATYFYMPHDITTDNDGNVYVAEFGGNVISKISAAGGVSVVAGDANQYGSVDGVGTQAQFYSPTGITLDSNNNLYVTDFVNERIRKVAPDGTVSTIAGSTASFADGSGSTALFNGPYAIRIHPDGNLVIADMRNNRIRKSTLDGNVITFAGSGNVGEQWGFGTDADISNPSTIAVDEAGNIFTTDNFGNLRWIDTNGRVNTIWLEDRLQMIDGIAVDSNGAVYMSEFAGNRILKVTYQ